MTPPTDLHRYARADRAMTAWAAWVRAGRPRSCSTGPSICAAIERLGRLGCTVDNARVAGSRPPRGGWAELDAVPALVDRVMYGDRRHASLPENVQRVLIARYAPTWRGLWIFTVVVDGEVRAARTAKDMAKALGISRDTFYRRLGRGLAAVEAAMDEKSADRG